MDNEVTASAGYETKIKEYYPMIYKFVYMQVKSRADAQDITQEVFLNILLAILIFRM